MARQVTTLDGARAVVTGASSGIGRALVLELARHGVRLAVVARRAPLLEELADAVALLGATRPLVLPADLGRRGAAAELAERAQQQLGGVDILVNNAGVSIIGAQHVVGDGELARTVYETNYWSPLALAAALAPGMRTRGRGCIVNVTSTLQAVPLPLLGYYGASKAALARATQVMRQELAACGLRVMEVVPGGTDTPTRQQDLLLPVRRKLPRPPLAAPQGTAEAIVRGLLKGARRVVHPASSYLPLELPAAGRGIARLAGSYIDAGSETVLAP